MDQDAPPSLYAILQVPRHASDQDIKRSYRRLALQHHPDKTTDSNSAMFKQIAHASEILLDHDKRRIYDKYGHLGLSMMESSPWVTPDRLDSLASLAVGIALVLLVLTVQLILVCVRVDSAVTASWHWFFLPLYFVSGLAWVSCLLALFTSGAAVPAVQATCVLAFVVLVVCSANGQVVFSWLVTIPYYLLELEGLVTHLIATFMPRDDDSQRTPLAPYLLSLYTPVCRITFATFVFARLTGVSDWAWGLVFIPVYVWPSRSFFFFLYSIVATQRSSGGSSGTTWRSVLLTKVLPLVVVYSIFYLIVGLINYKLDGGGVYLALALIPLWILLLVLIFVFGCIVPCILAFDLSDLDLDGFHFVPVNRRIEFISIP